MRTKPTTDLQGSFNEVYLNIEGFLEELDEIREKARSEEYKLSGDINLSNLRNLENYFHHLARRLREQTEFACRLADGAEACIEYITKGHNVMVMEEQE